MIVEIAMASRIGPSEWYEADDATLATAIEVLNRMYGKD